MAACESISRQDKTSVLGICSGGMISSMLMAHLADIGELDRVASFSLMVTVLDQERAGVTSALLSHKSAAASTRASQEKGYLDGRVARRDLRLAAPQRPDLELLGQQLPDGPRPEGLRHPLLER